VLRSEPMSHGSESECATHYTTAPQRSYRPLEPHCLMHKLRKYFKLRKRHHAFPTSVFTIWLNIIATGLAELLDPENLDIAL